MARKQRAEQWAEHRRQGRDSISTQLMDSWFAGGLLWLRHTGTSACAIEWVIWVGGIAVDTNITAINARKRSGNAV
jgi:hypothetical protein